MRAIRYDGTSTSACKARTAVTSKASATPWSHRQTLSLDGRKALRKLLAANKRLNTAYLLKESFGQLWSYRTERGARAFFERWKQGLRWQRLAPYQTFVRMNGTGTALPPTANPRTRSA